MGLELYKTEEMKRDIEYIKHQWGLHINKNVSYSYLTKILNELLNRGYSSKYLVFTMDYVVKNHKSLQFPQGFRYFVEGDDVKSAYRAYQLRQKGVKKMTDFKANDSNNSPTFTVNADKPVGFSSILGGDKD